MNGRHSKIVLLFAISFLAIIFPLFRWLGAQNWHPVSRTAADNLPPVPTFAITPASWKLQKMDRIKASDVQSTAMIMVDEKGRVLAERQADTRRPMASLTKIMTAAIVLEFAHPSSIVVIPKQATENLPADSAVMGISPGEKYTVEELLYGMLLPSGNDAAQALALAVAGSQSKFVALMNAKVAQLGLKDTHFTNASGLDGVGHYSTAHDLAIITHYAQSFPLFNTIVATNEKTLPYSSDHKALNLVNANPFIQMYPGATGVKPGNTGEAGNCLVASATRNGHSLIGVLLDTPGRNTNMIKLFNEGFDYLSAEK